MPQPATDVDTSLTLAVFTGASQADPVGDPQGFFLLAPGDAPFPTSAASVFTSATDPNTGIVYPSAATISQFSNTVIDLEVSISPPQGYGFPATPLDLAFVVNWS